MQHVRHRSRINSDADSRLATLVHQPAKLAPPPAGLMVKVARAFNLPLTQMVHANVTAHSALLAVAHPAVRSYSRLSLLIETASSPCYLLNRYPLCWEKQSRRPQTRTRPQSTAAGRRRRQGYSNSQRLDEDGNESESMSDQVNHIDVVSGSANYPLQDDAAVVWRRRSPRHGYSKKKKTAGLLTLLFSLLMLFGTRPMQHLDQ